jgi:hypothetical protein
MEMTVAQALAEGYEKCLQDGHYAVENIDDVATDELEENTYWVCEKEPNVFTVSPDQLRDMLSDHVARTQTFDDDDVSAQAVLEIPLEKFDQASELLNALLADKKWWLSTDIQLVP